MLCYVLLDGVNTSMGDPPALNYDRLSRYFFMFIINQ